MSIKDVARLAGVSTSTVSRVVSKGDKSAAGEEKRRKIWEAVKELDYQPNKLARMLKTGEAEQPVVRNKDIDCIYTRVTSQSIDPFFYELMQIIETQAFNSGYTLRYCYPVIDATRPEFSLNDTKSSSAVVLGRFNDKTIQMLKKNYKHLCYVGLNEVSFDIDQVLCSGYDAVIDCVNYLHSLGHTQICYMGETELEQRYQGYIDAMAQLGIEDTSRYVVNTPFAPTGGFNGVTELLSRGIPFTAIIFANDILALGAIKALNANKIRVPQDVSVIGVNDMESVRYLKPMLSVAHVPLGDMGSLALKILTNRIEGGHSKPVKLYIPHTIIKRESCAPSAGRV